MIYRIKTSKKTMEIFEKIGKSERLQPYILVKLSLSLAIRNGYKYIGSLDDMLGLDLNRQTIVGEYDILFKALIEMNEEKNIPEEKYFPDYVKAYVDYGATLLEQESRYSNDFYLHLLELDKGI